MNLKHKLMTTLVVWFVLAVFSLPTSAALVNEIEQPNGIVWHMSAVSGDEPAWDDHGTTLFPGVKRHGSVYVSAITIPSSITKLIVPERLEWLSHGSAPSCLPIVKYLKSGATDDHPYIETVGVNRNVELKNPCFRDCPRLKEFVLENTSQTDARIGLVGLKDGVLYDADFTDLKKYPEGKEGDSITVPASVKTIHQYTFANTKLKRIVFEGDAPKILQAYSDDSWATVSNTVVTGSKNLTEIWHKQDAAGWGRYWCGIRTGMILSPVKGVVATRGELSSGVKVAWNVNSEATKYRVYRSDANGRLCMGETWDSEFLDATAIPLEKYKYDVVAICCPTSENEIEGEKCNPVEGWAKEPVFRFSSDGIGATLEECVCAGGPLTIPSEYESVPVVRIGDFVFEGCRGLTSVTIPSSVTSIGDYAFSNCKGLTSVTIPSSVTSIGDYAFHWTPFYDNLPDGMVILGGGVLYEFRGECPSSVTIPEGITGIGAGAFYGCSGLTEVTIPSSVTSIGEGAFSGCERLQEIKVDSNNTAYCSQDGILYDYDKRTLICCPGGKTGTVTIPSSVTSIGEGAFAGCRGLTSVTIPEGVTSIGGYAFEGCSGLMSVTIPSSVMYVMSRFSDCWSLVEICFMGPPPIGTNDGFDDGSYAIGYYLPEYAAEWLGDYCWNDGYWMGLKMRLGNGPSKYVVYDDGACSWLCRECAGGVELIRCYCASVDSDDDAREYIEAYPRPSGDIEVPESVQILVTNDVGIVETQMLSVVALGYGLFRDCRELTSVTIPSSVTSIGDRAFYDCSGLTSVTIPSSVTSIGDYAFYGTPFYDNLPDGMVILGGGVLYKFKGECPSSVTIPEGVTSIGSQAFHNCSGLTSVTIPSSVTSIGNWAFAWCSELTSVTIPSSVTSIGDEAFWNCYGLTSVTIPSSVTSIGEGAFDYCCALQEIKVDSNNTAYCSQDGILYDYDKRTLICCPGGKTGAVTIPEGVMCIGHGAFFDCYGLTSVMIPPSVTSIGDSAFEGCCMLTVVTIPEGVTSIGDYAFAGCDWLTSVMIPPSVTSIGDSAFEGCCMLTVVTIPEGVTSIGDYAFAGCDWLTSVTIPSSVTSIGGCAFYNCSGLTSVTILSGVTSIGYDAFYDCDGLTSVTIPSSVTSIGNWAFEGCDGLKTVHVDNGDAERVKGLYHPWPSGVEFVEIDRPIVIGDEGATVTGDAEKGFVVRPSEGNATVVVTIPSGMDAAKVTIEVSPKVTSVTPHGAKVKIVSGGADITEFLNVPVADGDGVVDLTKATVKEEIVKEALDPEKGAKIELNAANPSLTTPNTRVGLFYQFREGATPGGMADGDSTIGDGKPWSPEIKVKGGKAAFYSIGVGKGE